MSPPKSKKAARKAGKAAKTAARAKGASRKSARKAPKAAKKAGRRPADKGPSPASKPGPAGGHAHCAATDPFGDECQNLPRRPSKYCVIHSYLDR